MFSAVLDTCVLWPSLQRDLLLSRAIEGLYRPLWSSAILEELEMHEAGNLVDRGASAPAAARSAQRLVTQMSAAFDDACVEPVQSIDEVLEVLSVRYGTEAAVAVLEEGAR